MWCKNGLNSNGVFQIMVKATDGGSPARVSSQQARITVRVTRNANTPRWTGSLPYKTKVNENNAVNSKIFQVRADDRDPTVSTKLCYWEL